MTEQKPGQFAKTRSPAVAMIADRTGCHLSVTFKVI